MPKQTPPKVFILIIAALASGIAGFGLIKIVRSFDYVESQLPEENGSEQNGEETSEQGQDLEEGWTSYKGVIDIAREAPTRQITHVLLDENGEPIIYLMANDQKLVISEAMDVEVQGKVQNIKGSTDLVLFVERVVFK